jgi:tetratricopeptide (TPR) repeat protein
VKLRLLIVAALAAFLSACASTPGSQRALDEFSSRQAVAASQAQEDGRLRDALSLWQTVVAAVPGDPDALAAIHALKSTIEDETDSAIRKGEAAYGQGKRSEGDRWMLRALALTPGEPIALAALRLSVSGASHERQEQKVQSAYAGLEEKKPVAAEASEAAVSDPVEELKRLFDQGSYDAVLQAVADADADDARYAALARDSHIALARRAGDAKQPEQRLRHLDQALAISSAPGDPLWQERRKLAEGLSDDYYRQSLALLKSDLDGAIAALEKSVMLNPDNIAAKDKLDQAQTLKQNLNRIRSE